MGETRNAYKTVIGKLQTIPFRPKHRWEDNIKMGLTEISCENASWIKLS
jgi:hypothetical protein